MSEKRFTYTTTIITDKKGYRKDYIWSNKTLLHTEQIVGILNEQDEYIDYVTKERNLACNKLDNYKEKIREQQATITKQDEEIRKLKRTERSWRRIHCCNKESDNCGIVIEQQATLTELQEENEQLRKERAYWEQSSSHRKRLLEDAEKELRLHNAYLVDKGQAENYTRWKRSNLKWEWTQCTSQEK